MTFGAAPFGSTPFGAAAGATPRLVTGFTSTQFGTPYVPIAQGFLATNFGLPNSLRGFGFRNTQFGTPEGHLAFHAASLGPTTRFSWAYYAFTQTVTASGSTSTRFGTPLATRRSPSGLGQMTFAHGFLATTFGTPNAPVARGGTASGFISVQFGTPTYMPVNARLATGFSRTRFGIPAGRSIIGGRYTTGSVSTQFGTPTGRINNRATAMPPVTVFGVPVLTRNTTC